MRSNHLEAGHTLSDPAFNTHLADTLAGTDKANCIFSPGTGYGLSFSVVLDKEEVVEVDKDGAGIGQCSVGTCASPASTSFLANSRMLLGRVHRPRWRNDDSQQPFVLQRWYPYHFLMLISIRCCCNNEPPPTPIGTHGWLGLFSTEYFVDPSKELVVWFSSQVCWVSVAGIGWVGPGRYTPELRSDFANGVYNAMGM
jgi:hypothetical protein